MRDAAVDRPAFDQPFLIARVEEARLAIPSAWVGEMIVLPVVAALPLAPEAVRGVGMRRGRTVTMLDARLRLGYVSRAEETARLVALLEAREAEHVRWVDALLESVDLGTPFTMSRDPAACAFGQWYAQYVPPTLTLRQHLAKFDEPHRAVHALADEAEALTRTQGRAAAHEHIETFRTSTLGRMRQLFRDARTLLQDDIREIAITHEVDGQVIGLIVDEIESVERLRADTLDDLAGRVPGGDDTLVRWSARTAREHVVVLPDMHRLVEELAPVRAA